MDPRVWVATAIGCVLWGKTPHAQPAVELQTGIAGGFIDDTVVVIEGGVAGTRINHPSDLGLGDDECAVLRLEHALFEPWSMRLDLRR